MSSQHNPVPQTTTDHRRAIGEVAGTNESPSPVPYESPRIVTWAASDLDDAAVTLNACISFVM